ncbi:MAG TPA: hypothetical protein VH054_15440 [Polyangiaceae bacterium]|nr:hypothetical protein [Polyangiaceae bacterium]
MKRLLIVLLAAACSSTPEKSTAEAKTPEGAKPLDHEKCEDSMGRAEVLNASDGKFALKQIFDKTSGRELCRIADLNHDGKPDMYEYYNADGSLRRREGAYENGDAISEIQIYENGKLVRRERDTTGQRKVDTWDTYDPATGKLVKRERDNNGDGKVDQWWTWDGQNITIAIDKNGDGQPDPDQTITVGPNGQAVTPPSPSAMATGDGGAGGGASLPPPPPPPVLYTSSPVVDAGAPKKKPAGAKK